MTKEDIRKLIGREKCAELECKSAKGGFPESFWETFSAFANTYGGIIVFGIKEQLFMFLGNGEKAGSGAVIIKKGWNDNQWPTPELTERTQPDETTMTLRLMVDAGGKERMHTVGEIVGEAVLPKLSNRQSLIVEFLRKSPSMSAKAMSESLSVSPRTIERVLQKLTAMGVVTHKGSDFGGEWVVLI